MKKTDWRKGEGEFLGGVISIIFLCYLLFIILGLFNFYNTSISMDNALTEISRDIVVCTSLDEARDTAREEAEDYLEKIGNIRKESISAEVDFAAGSIDEEWRKGNFIDITISAYINTSEPFTSQTKTATTTVMIERNGGDTNAY